MKKITRLTAGIFLLVAALVWFLTGTRTMAAEKAVNVSLQYAAFAPNAGGQVAYGIRGLRNNREIAIFQNQYLTAGGQPLLGVLYAWRFPICDESCMVHLHTQVGIGLTSAGPLVEFLWGTEIPILPLGLNGGTIPYVPMLRVDVASHWMATHSRLITWSYPFWVGVTLPL